MLHLLHLPVKYLILIFLQLLFIAADHQLIIEYEHKLQQCPDEGGIRKRPGQQDKNGYDDMQDILPACIHDKNKQKKCRIEPAVPCIQECRKNNQGSGRLPQQSVSLLPKQPQVNQQRQQYQNLHNKSRLQRFIISSCTRCFIPLLTGMHS